MVILLSSIQSAAGKLYFVWTHPVLMITSHQSSGIFSIEVMWLQKNNHKSVSKSWPVSLKSEKPRGYMVKVLKQLVWFILFQEDRDSKSIGHTKYTGWQKTSTVSVLSQTLFLCLPNLQSTEPHIIFIIAVSSFSSASLFSLIGYFLTLLSLFLLYWQQVWYCILWGKLVHITNMYSTCMSVCVCVCSTAKRSSYEVSAAQRLLICGYNLNISLK